MHRFKLAAGDYSMGVYRETSSVIVLCNRTSEEVSAAHAELARRGLNIAEEFCNTDKDSEEEDRFLRKLKKELNIDPYRDYQVDVMDMTINGYVKIYMAMARTLLPGLVFRFDREEQLPVIPIGGSSLYK